MEIRVKVVGVFGDEETARAEVLRLNELNRGKECRYFLQVTHFRRAPITNNPITNNQ